MTDERMGDALWTALKRLPRGGGVVFRHHRTGQAERKRLFTAVRSLCRARNLVLLLAGPPRLAIGWKANGAHGRSPHRGGARQLIRSVPVHNRREQVKAERLKADLIFVSPVFPTRSHPGAPTLGRVRFARLAHRNPARTIALGGMTAAQARSLAGAGGWAAIDAWIGAADQKRKAVPR